MTLAYHICFPKSRPKMGIYIISYLIHTKCLFYLSHLWAFFRKKSDWSCLCSFYCLRISLKAQSTQHSKRRPGHVYFGNVAWERRCSNSERPCRKNPWLDIAMLEALKRDLYKVKKNTGYCMMWTKNVNMRDYRVTTTTELWLVGSFNPSEKYAQIKLDHYPRDQGQHKQYLKPTPSFIWGVLKNNDLSNRVE